MINKNQQQEEERRDNDTSSSPAATGNSDGSIVVVQEETVDSTTVKEEGEEEEEEGVREDAIIRRSARLRSGKQEEEIKTPKSKLYSQTTCTCNIVLYINVHVQYLVYFTSLSHRSSYALLGRNIRAQILITHIHCTYPSTNLYTCTYTLH